MFTPTLFSSFVGSILHQQHQSSIILIHSSFCLFAPSPCIDKNNPLDSCFCFSWLTLDNRRRSFVDLLVGSRHQEKRLCINRFRKLEFSSNSNNNNMMRQLLKIGYVYAIIATCKCRLGKATTVATNFSKFQPSQSTGKTFISLLKQPLTKPESPSPEEFITAFIYSLTNFFPDR